MTRKRRGRRSSRYAAYMRSPAWHTRRARAVARAGGRCQRCGTRGPLDVHHRTYVRLGRERAADLEALCRPCHRRADAERRRL